MEDKIIKQKVIGEVVIEDLDLVNVDDIFGLNEDGHDYDTTYVDNVVTRYNNTNTLINITSLVDICKILKEAGSSHVQILHHGDHHGYVFTGNKLSKVAQKDIRDDRREKLMTAINEDIKERDEYERRLDYAQKNLDEKLEELKQL